MAIKRILLPVNDRDDLSLVAELAFILAREFGAQIEGVFPQYDVAASAALVGDEATASAIKDLLAYAEEEAKEAAQKAESAFKTLSAAHPEVTANFVLPGGNVAEKTAHRAVQADLTVIGDGTHYADEYWSDVRDGALFLSGRPVLVAPAQPVSEKLGERVVIAWKQCAEASRAMAAAMPFVARAQDVWLVIVDSEEEAERNAHSMAEYLELHGPGVTLDLLRADDRSIGELLVGKAAEKEGTILVMGAYGHWRWRERIFGGVTEHVLTETQAPVLMAH